MDSRASVDLSWIVLLFLGLLFIGMIGLVTGTAIFVDGPRNQAFCLDQGFSNWDYADEVTGISYTIVCSEKGELKYFTYEDGEYYEVNLYKENM